MMQFCIVAGIQEANGRHKPEKSALSRRRGKNKSDPTLSYLLPLMTQRVFKLLPEYKI